MTKEHEYFGDHRETLSYCSFCGANVEEPCVDIGETRSCIFYDDCIDLDE